MSPHRCCLLPLFVARARKAGVDVAPLYRRFGLPSSGDVTRDVPELPWLTLWALYDQLAEIVGDSFLGLHVAQQYPRGTFGVVELAAMSAPNLREALARLSRHVGIVNPDVRFRLEARGFEARLEYRVNIRNPSGGRQLHEAIICIVAQLCRTATRGRWRADRAWFMHPEPRDTSELVSFFRGAALTFGCDSNGLGFAAAHLDLPFVTADPALLPILDDYASLLMRKLPYRREDAENLVERVRQQLRHSLTDGEAGLAHSAKALAMTGRTLQRQLEESGTTFQRVLDEVRRDMASSYLQDRHMKLSEVAFLLGYSEFSSFLRAYKRWTGTTPGRVRRGT